MKANLWLDRWRLSENALRLRFEYEYGLKLQYEKQACLLKENSWNTLLCSRFFSHHSRYFYQPGFLYTMLCVNLFQPPGGAEEFKV